MNATADLTYWIAERESMRLRKFQMYGDNMLNVVDPGPLKHGWSHDPAMGIPRYCNIRREDDRVTQWLAQNWRPDHHEVWEIVLARMINLIPSLSEIVSCLSTMDPIVDVTDALKDRRSRGEKVFTSAYTISTCGESMDKIDYVMRVVAEVKDRCERKLLGTPPSMGVAPRLEYTYEALSSVPGLGSFLSAQVVADLKNTDGHYLRDATDWWTWCAPGPGSKRGLSWYFFGKPDALINDRNFHKLITKAWEEVEPLLPDYAKPLHMQDFQNCLCEFSKYMRFKNGDRRVRNKYRAG